MVEYYAAIRSVHIGCALLSVLLFVLRGGLMLAESPLLQSRVLRYLPHAVDTVLLTSALMLTTIVRQYPFADAWLTAKVLLLVLYIVLGSIALRRGRTRRTRTVTFAAALVVVLMLLSVARTRSPLGVFAAFV